MDENDVLSPTESTPDPPQPSKSAASLQANVESTPQKNVFTPSKSVAGHLYNSQQYRTPTTARPGHSVASAASGYSSGGPLSQPGVSPCLRTPGSAKPPSGLGTGSSHRHVARLRTPHSGGSGRKVLITPRHLTPIIQMTPKGSRTPQGVYNPFDNAQVDQLHGSVFSPNMFAEVIPEGGEKTPQSFRWSIGERAILMPVDIDDKEIEAQYQQLYQNPELEERAQRAIDQYFSSQKNIAPSPWADSAKRKPLQELPRTPGMHSADSPLVLQIKPKLNKDEDITLLRDAASQTTISLPLNFDLEKVLAEHCYNEPAIHAPATSTTTGRPSHSAPVSRQSSSDPEDGGGGGDVLSNSSLRRKLFFHGDQGTPLSPVRPSMSKVRGPAAEHMDYQLSPQVSPVKASPHTPTHHHKPVHCASHIMDTPGSGHFSSSPIHSRGSGDSLYQQHHMTTSAATAVLRRCSTAPDLMDSPHLSPIGDMAANAASTSQSSSAKPPSGGLDMDSPMLHTPGAPYMMMQATPNSVGGRPEMVFSSPGMSPIVLADGSFTASSPHSSNHSHGSGRMRGHRSHGPPAKVPVPTDLQPSGSPQLGITGRSHDDDDLMISTADDSIQQMDYEEDDLDLDDSDDPVVYTGIVPRGLRRSRDEVDLGDEYSTTQVLQHTQDTQDTGYHTNSLQSTNHDTVGIGSNNNTCSDGTALVQHTNLTAQFGSMPFGLDDNNDLELNDLDNIGHGHQATKYQGMEPMPVTTASVIPRKVTSLIAAQPPSSSANFTFSKQTAKKDCSACSESLDLVDHDNVVERARQALSKVSKSVDSPLSTHTFKPRIINTMGVPRFPWQPFNDGSSYSGSRNVYSRPAVIKEKIMGEETGQVPVLPASEVASQALQRAVGDYEKYCIKQLYTSLDSPSPHHYTPDASTPLDSNTQ